MTQVNDMENEPAATVVPDYGLDDLHLWPFDLPFELPDPPRQHPHYRATYDHTARWLRDKGVIDSDAGASMFARADGPAWSVLCYPRVSLDSHKLISDFISLAIEWDGLLGTPESRGCGTQVFGPMLVALDGAEPDLNGNRFAPFTCAWADMWQRWQAGMPDTFRRRTSQTWRETLHALIAEDADEFTGQIPTYRERAKTRDDTGLQPVLIDLIERSAGYTVPEAVLSCQPMRELCQHTSRVIWMTNETQSLPKEEARGETNLVMMMEASEAMTRAESLAQIHRLVRGHTDGFLAAEASIPETLDRIHLPVSQRRAVYDYITGLRAVMSGTYVWSTYTGRYRL